MTGFVDVTFLLNSWYELLVNSMHIVSITSFISYRVLYSLCPKKKNSNLEGVCISWNKVKKKKHIM